MRRLSARTATDSTCARVGPVLTLGGTNLAVVPIAARPATDTATTPAGRSRPDQRRTANLEALRGSLSPPAPRGLRLAGILRPLGVPRSQTSAATTPRRCRGRLVRCALSATSGSRARRVVQRWSDARLPLAAGGMNRRREEQRWSGL